MIASTSDYMLSREQKTSDSYIVASQAQTEPGGRSPPTDFFNEENGWREIMISRVPKLAVKIMPQNSWQAAQCLMESKWYYKSFCCAENTVGKAWRGSVAVWTSSDMLHCDSIRGSDRKGRQIPRDITIQCHCSNQMNYRIQLQLKKPRTPAFKENGALLINGRNKLLLQSILKVPDLRVTPLTGSCRFLEVSIRSVQCKLYFI